MIPPVAPAAEVMNREFLTIRARLIDVAAAPVAQAGKTGRKPGPVYEVNPAVLK